MSAHEEMKRMEELQFGRSPAMDEPADLPTLRAAHETLMKVTVENDALRARIKELERRAGLSPIARTEIERVRDDMRRTIPQMRETGETWAASVTDKWASALDSVLGAESTKETKP